MRLSEWTTSANWFQVAGRLPLNRISCRSNASLRYPRDQGYEVVEFIKGNDILPADHGILEDKFRPLPFGLDVDGTLELVRERIPLKYIL